MRKLPGRAAVRCRFFSSMGLVAEENGTLCEVALDSQLMTLSN
jgi:hypothetical protein